jgi:hypothetical protein
MDRSTQPRTRRSRVVSSPLDSDTQLVVRNMSAPERPVELDPDPETAQRAGRVSALPSGTWQPSEDEIRLRAYHRYLERGGGHGQAFDDWLEAEKELKAVRTEGVRTEEMEETV